MGQDSGLGSPHGGGPQGEPVEGSLTDGGSLPGNNREDRSFGAGRRAGGAEQARDDTGITGAQEPQIFEGQGEDSGATGAPGEEHSGYGNTPPR